MAMLHGGIPAFFSFLKHWPHLGDKTYGTTTSGNILFSPRQPLHQKNRKNHPRKASDILPAASEEYSASAADLPS